MNLALNDETVRVFPAPAGINRVRSGTRIPPISVPRASGDKPDQLKELAADFVVFPAPAGINRPWILSDDRDCSVPRVSGDKPQIMAVFNGFCECSPRQRG
ncbi:hypothetical protein ICQ57_002200 [Salmonella enterica]|nr:hypothetical protein [Salmonella enterica]